MEIFIPPKQEPKEKFEQLQIELYNIVPFLPEKEEETNIVIIELF